MLISILTRFKIPVFNKPHLSCFLNPALSVYVINVVPIFVFIIQRYCHVQHRQLVHGLGQTKFDPGMLSCASGDLLITVHPTAFREGVK